jgi:RNA-binding protein YhbY
MKSIYESKMVVFFLILLLFIALHLPYVMGMAFKPIGKFRRQLRAIANQKKSEGLLSVMHVSGHQDFSEAFYSDVRSNLMKHELVQVKTRVKKKKDAVVLGDDLALNTDSEVAQVVGHSILLFKSNDKGEVTQLLTKAMGRMDEEVAADL